MKNQEEKINKEEFKREKEERQQAKKERELWTGVIIAYTGASNSLRSDNAIAWADKILDAYRVRFNK